MPLPERAELAIRFQRDAYKCSFGTDSGFEAKFGADGEEYLNWLKHQIGCDARFAVHVWLDREIIGQVELGKSSDSPGTGIVFLYYLKSEFRGLGIGGALDDYAQSVMESLDLQTIELNVSNSNAGAMIFYLKRGWAAESFLPGTHNLCRMKRVLGS